MMVYWTFADDEGMPRVAMAGPMPEPEAVELSAELRDIGLAPFRIAEPSARPAELVEVKL